MSGVPCPDCVSGTLSVETSTGTETTIHGRPTYIAAPEGESKGLIVFITDAFGWKFPNNRVLADKFAKKGGYTVYIPDFMDGHGCSAEVLTLMDFITTPTSWLTTIFVKPLYIARVLWNFIPFIVRCRESVCKPRVVDFMKTLRTAPDTANLKIGVVGYCWGGLHAVKLAHDTPSSRIQRYGSEAGELKPLVDAVFTAHPSMLSIPADVENVTVPLSIAIGDVDFVLKISEVEKAKTILKKKSDDHEVVIYPGGKHGFAIRGDPKDPKQKEFADQAEEQALSWFSKWLA